MRTRQRESIQPELGMEVLIAPSRYSRIGNRGDGSTLNLDFTQMAYTGSGIDERIIWIRGSSQARFIGSDGYIAVASFDEPRFDYDPITLESKGLLIEGQVTNLLRRSDTFDTTTSAWVYDIFTRTIVTGTAPSGADQSIVQTQNASSGTIRSIATTVTASTAYTFSFWAKNNGGTKAHYRVWNVTAGSAIVDHTSPTASYFAQLSSTVWNRISVTFTTPAGCTSIYVYPISEDSTGSNLFIWGAQLELGTGASSYIRTTVTPTTRAADFAVIDGSNFSDWFTGGTKGTFFVDWIGGVRGTTSTVRTVISTGDIETEHLHLQQVSAAGALKVADFGAAHSVSTSNSITSGARTKGAFSFNGSTVNVCLNGGTVATSSAIAFSSIPSWFVLGGVSSDGGSLTDAATVLNGNIRQIKYFPTALTNAQLISLTK